MEIILVAATPFEIAPTLAYLEKGFRKTEAGVFEKNGFCVRPLVTGVGMVATAFQLGAFFAKNRPALAINAGIAGAFDPAMPLGKVVHISSERFADLGVEEADGRFTDLFALQLLGPDAPPFSNGILKNPHTAPASFLPAASGMTVNCVHGYAPSIEAARIQHPDVQVESMEGAAFFYACLLADIPFFEIRSISNRVEPRNRSGWDLPLAIGNLNQVLTEMLEAFQP